MWLILSDGFLSAVVSKENPEVIQVRARRKEHLTKYFPTKEVVTHDHRDYQFRVIVNRAELQEMLVKYVAEMMYSNFKDSTTDRRFHDACYDVWDVMAKLQPKPPYSAYSGKSARPNTRDYLGEQFVANGYGNHQYGGKHRSATIKRGR